MSLISLAPLFLPTDQGIEASKFGNKERPVRCPIFAGEMTDWLVNFLGVVAMKR